MPNKERYFTFFHEGELVYTTSEDVANFYSPQEDPEVVYNPPSGAVPFHLELPPQGEFLGVRCCCGGDPFDESHNVQCSHRGHATKRYSVWYYGCGGQIIRNGGVQ